MQKEITSVLSSFEIVQARNARHRALIMQILSYFPLGLTTQQIIAKELEIYGFTFLTDNRLRELRQRGWIINEGEKPTIWKKVSE